MADPQTQIGQPDETGNQKLRGNLGETNRKPKGQRGEDKPTRGGRDSWLYDEAVRRKIEKDDDHIKQRNNNEEQKCFLNLPMGSFLNWFTS